MANKPVAPAWCENAIPTANGWEDPDTGELYVSGGSVSYTHLTLPTITGV